MTDRAESKGQEGRGAPKIRRLLLVRIFQDVPNASLSHPLGIMHLASYVRAKRPEVEVRLLDMRLGRLAPEDLAPILRAYAPDTVGLSALSCESAILPKICAAVKDFDSSIRVIAGGPHASSDPERISMDPNVDVCVVGEGEEQLVDLIDRWETTADLHGIDGVAFRSDDGFFVRTNPREYIEDVNDLPWPAWDLIDWRAYSKRNPMSSFLGAKPYMTLFTSRACPYRCSYCHEIFGKSFRAMTPERVLEQMDFLAREMGVREFQIVDDIFNWDAARAEAIMDGIVERGLKVKIAFPNGVRADRMTPALVKKFARAGTYSMAVAVESASPRIQSAILKHNDLEKVRQTIDAAYREGIIVKGFFMLGFPTESVEELRATVDFALKSKCLIASFFTVVPFPGSDLWDMAIREYPEWERMAVDSHYYEEAPYYTQAHGVDLRKIQRSALLRFYLNPWRMATTLWRIPYKRDLFRNLYPLAQITFGWFMRGKNAKIDKQVALGQAIEAMNTV